MTSEIGAPRGRKRTDSDRLDWLAQNSTYFNSAIEMEHNVSLDCDAPDLRAAIDYAMDNDPQALRIYTIGYDATGNPILLSQEVKP